MATTISYMMEFANQNLQDSVNEIVIKKLASLGGDGGLTAIDKDRNITMPFKTEGMFRVYILSRK